MNNQLRTLGKFSCLTVCLLVFLIPAIVAVPVSADTGSWMSVIGHEITIPDGDTSPQTDDLTNFGVLGLNGEIKEHMFTILNNGSESLYLTGVPLIAISGTHAADFTVTALPVSPIVSGGSTTFRLTFDPSAPGIRTATISIVNSFTPLEPYDFSIQGVGEGPDMSINGNGNEILDGDTIPATTDFTDFGLVDVISGSVMRTFTIENTGTVPVNLTGTPPVAILGTHASDFTVTVLPATVIAATTGNTTFQVTFAPSAVGLRSATISITNSDPYSNPYNFNIQGTGISPEIRITGNGRDIFDGTSVAFAADFTDFGTVDTVSGPVLHTFIVTNSGKGQLDLTGTPQVTISGAHAADFTVTAMPASTIAGGDSSSFQITFSPSGVGLRTATVSIASNDPDENPYTFFIQGTGSTSGIAITGNGYTIPNNDTSPRPEDFTEFGSVNVLQGNILHTFTIFNNRPSQLDLNGTPPVSVSGAQAADFTVTRSPSTTIAATTGSTTFQITFDPSAVGVRNATITVVSNDLNNNPYRFAVRGTGVLPEINLKQNTTAIASGGTYDFGSRVVSTSADVVFTVQNTGTDDLTLGTAAITSGDDSQFTIVTQPGATIAAAGATSFTVRFTPASTGVKTATIKITNNDSDENPYTLVINGTGTTAEPTTPPATTQTVAVSGFTGGSMTVDSRGIVEDSVSLTSSDDRVKLVIAAGTMMLDTRQKPLTQISVRQVEEIPAPPPEGTIVAMYEFGADGATFSPAITLRILYRADTGETVSLACWDGTTWVFLETTYDEDAGELLAEISHFSLYAVIVTGEEQEPVVTTGTSTTTATVTEPAPSTGTSDESGISSWVWWLIIAVGMVAAIGSAVQYQLTHRKNSSNKQQ